MLTDIFADRYAAHVLWERYTETESRLIAQCYQIVAQDVIPYWVNGKVSDDSKTIWQSVHDCLCRELGLIELAPQYYSYQTMHLGTPHTVTGAWTVDRVCKTFLLATYTPTTPADRFIKERLSLIELAFRQREAVIAVYAANRLASKMSAAALEQSLNPHGPRIPGNAADAEKSWHQRQKETFQTSVGELNERFRRARAPLNYHNGYIQIADDELIESRIETPFWALVGGALWENVDIDMKEALDRRDTGGRDPAFYAARALESTIKIISKRKNWTRGTENGPHAYIDNLVSARNGRFIETWESEALKHYFTKVRNPLGHGPGDEEMPELSSAQTDWAIETSMSWIKALVSRM